MYNQALLEQKCHLLKTETQNQAFKKYNCVYRSWMILQVNAGHRTDLSPQSVT